VYLGVAEVRDPAGRVCDHLVAMRRMPASRRLSALIQAGEPISAAVRQVVSQRDFLARYFADSVEPILIPLAADAAHPFPFISNLGLNPFRPHLRHQTH
jgi:polyphosphate kinase